MHATSPSAAHAAAAYDLNAEQRAAVEHDPAAGALLVVAGAGTGKTATLAARVAWLARRGTPLHRILLVTFSRRAAREMERRAGQMLLAALGAPSGLPPPALPWCGTFHSLAARLLREEAPRIGLADGFTVLDRGDAEDLMGIVRQRAGLADDAWRFPLAVTCLAIHSRQVNTQRPLAELLAADWPWYGERAADLARLFDAYGAAKRAQRSLDYDDLLLAWWHLMREPVLAARIAARFDHVLVDELQDVNRLQADLVHALRPHGDALTVVGDDAQAIYAFRGASVAHMLGFAERCAAPARLIRLEQNYRSTPAILDASNAVMAEAAEGFAKRLWSTRPNGLPPRLVTAADEAAQAAGVADAVLAAREGGLALRRQAALFRSASHGVALEFELLRRRIPFVKYGGLRFVESAHVKDVLSVLRWADNPAATLAAWRTARLVPGIGPTAARRLVDGGGDSARFAPPRAAAAGWRALRSLLDALRGGTLGWPGELRAVLAWYRPHLERLHADARVRWADLEQLLQAAAAHASRERFVTELALDPPAASSDEAGEPLRDDDYLILSTMHSAKGQEWNAVHVLNVVDGCLPADLATGDMAAIEEERRLLYVAMTRARDELTLWAPQRFFVTQQRSWGDRHLYALPSRFLTPPVMARLDRVGPAGRAHDAPDGAGPESPPAAATGAAADTDPDGRPLLDVMALLRGAA
ncbi:MAG: ATP-dependent helicase [Burkholderiales bacterium]|nr:ATP-dependent helicase [Burkholderiales bacterium]